MWLVLLTLGVVVVWMQSSLTPGGRAGPGPAQKDGQSLPAMFRPLASSASKMVPLWSLTAATLNPRGSHSKVPGAEPRRLKKMPMPLTAVAGNGAVAVLNIQFGPAQFIE